MGTRNVVLGPWFVLGPSQLGITTVRGTGAQFGLDTVHGEPSDTGNRECCRTSPSLPLIGTGSR